MLILQLCGAWYIQSIKSKMFQGIRCRFVMNVIANHLLENIYQYGKGGLIRLAQLVISQALN